MLARSRAHIDTLRFISFLADASNRVNSDSTNPNSTARMVLGKGKGPRTCSQKPYLFIDTL